MADKQPHDSAVIYSERKRKHWFKIGSKVAQAERPERSRGQWILLGLLVIFAVFGGSFLGFILEVQVLNPPTQVVGVCPSPAYVSGNDCVQKVCTTNAQNVQTCSVQEAGYIVGQGGSRVVCNNGICVATP